MTSMNFQHPFQCVQFIQRQQASSQDLLVASAGPKIYSYAAESGERLAVWPQDVELNDVDSSTAIDADSSTEVQEPPEKKRKVTPPPDQEVEGSKSSSQKSEKPKAPAWSSIPFLGASSDGKYVLAFTAEDKCIRVFAVGEDGILQPLSERCMPKRLSSIAFACNDTVLLCGDKFGDVYSLPLIPDEHWKATTATKAYQPRATTLTVHTKRNLEALQQQIRYSAKPRQDAADKGSLNFEHQVLLGHVSLLTDLAYVSFPVDPTSGAKRSYILTADRDEHIRVSRGPPQAHVIENYCMGHTSFISKLCIPAWAPETLISGGGDNYLLVWKWAEGEGVQKVSLVEEGSEVEVTVSGIWAASLADSSETRKVILVTLEGASQVLCYSLEPNGELKAQGSIQASGNVLDASIIEKNGTIMLSVDGVREPDSTESWRASPSSPQTLIESFRVKSGQDSLEWEPVNEPITTRINSAGTSDISPANEKERKGLDESLYALKNLRKKAFGEDD